MQDEAVRAKSTMHSPAAEAATIALKANVDKLIIGHYSARYNHKNGLLNEARAVFEKTIAAEDMSVYEI